MIIDIPGYKKLQITTLLLDYNGTIAEDGIIRPAVKERLQKLSKELSISHRNIHLYLEFLPSLSRYAFHLPSNRRH